MPMSSEWNGWWSEYGLQLTNRKQKRDDVKELMFSEMHFHISDNKFVIWIRSRFAESAMSRGRIMMIWALFVHSAVNQLCDLSWIICIMYTNFLMTGAAQDPLSTSPSAHSVRSAIASSDHVILLLHCGCSLYCQSLGHDRDNVFLPSLHKYRTDRIRKWLKSSLHENGMCLSLHEMLIFQ